MKETQQSISDWANQTFGDTNSNLRVAIRANSEMAELLNLLAVDDNHPKAPEEIADVFIVLYRCAERLNANVAEEIQRKMAINRNRKWRLDSSGCGQHVETNHRS